MTDFRALCAELLDWAEVTAAHYILMPAVVLRARAALAEPEPEGPTDEDLLNLHDWMTDEWATNHDFELPPSQYARAVLARWGTPNFAETRSSLGDAPQPVPVSERLPGDQLCWWYEPDEDDDGTGYGGNWTLLRIRGCVSYCTHWLPAHALPLPTAND